MWCFSKDGQKWSFSLWRWYLGKALQEQRGRAFQQGDSKCKGPEELACFVVQETVRRSVCRVSKMEVGGCCRLPSLKADAETKSHHNNFYWHLDSNNLKVTRWRELANKYFWKNVLLNYKKHNSDQSNNFINVIKAILLASSFWFLYL